MSKILPTQPLPPPSTEKKIQVSVWLDPVLVKALKHEAIDRDMTIGEIVTEALRRRVILTEHS